MTRALLLVVAASLGSPLLAGAQERSVGVSVAPFLRMHDEATCCSGVGVWLQVGRFQVEHAIGINAWDVAKYDEDLGVEGRATSVLFDVRTWRTPRLVTRLRLGFSDRPAEGRIDRYGAVHVGVTVDFPAGGRSFLRTGLHVGRFPPEPQLGTGFRF